MGGFVPPTDVRTGKIGGGGDFPRTLGQRVVVGVIALIALGVTLYFGLR